MHKSCEPTYTKPYTRAWQSSQRGPRASSFELLPSARTPGENASNPDFTFLKMRQIGLPRWLSGEESASQEGDTGSILSREDALEKEMATHCSVLAWRIPWIEAPGELQSRHRGWRVRTIENRTSGRRSWCPERHLHAQAETPVVQHNCCFPSFLLNLFSHWLNTLKFHPWTTMGSRDLTLIFSLSLF